jgi:hypothetical protein
MIVLITSLSLFSARRPAVERIMFLSAVNILLGRIKLSIGSKICEWKRNDNNIAFYKFTHASSSSGVLQSLARAASLNNMVSGIYGKYGLHDSQTSSSRFVSEPIVY